MYNNYEGNMDIITGAVLSGITYDILKNQAKISASALKERLKEWLIDEDTAIKLSEELSNLSLSDEMSEKAIQHQVNSSDSILHLLTKIQPKHEKTVNQVHIGIGDNIGGNKIIKG